jgi:hypothetical protein
MKRGGAVLLAVLGVLASGCLVHVDRISDPRPAFAAARDEAMDVQGRPGPAQRLNILAYDPDDEQLVHLELPMWLVRELDDDDLVIDGDWDCDSRLRRKVRRNLRIEDLERAGLGIIVEVSERDGERVLIWLS